MRGLASCYNEHAIRVSDSYCSSRHSSQAYLCPKLTLSTKFSVTCMYRVNMSKTQQQLFITLTWTKKLLGQGFTITITTTTTTNNNNTTLSDNSPSKFNTNSHQLRKRKGNESFKSSDFEVQVMWDLSDAKYNEGPEPSTGFYVVVLVNSELCLRLGDKDDEEESLDLNRGFGSFAMVSRSERFCGTAIYATKAKFSDSGTAHDILIKCDDDNDEGFRGHHHNQNQNQNHHVLSVCMDEKTIFQVKRLRWNFRGNQTIFVDGLVVDMMWDVHDWLFNNKGSAVFMFRTRSGLDSRLWLEEKNFQRQNKEQDKVNNGFSLLISACKSPDQFHLI